MPARADRADGRRGRRGQPHAGGRVQHLGRPGGRAARLRERHRRDDDRPRRHPPGLLQRGRRRRAPRERAASARSRPSCSTSTGASTARSYPELGGSPLHDPVAVAHVIDPGLVETRPALIEVDCGWEQGRGRTNVDWRGRRRAPSRTRRSASTSTARRSSRSSASGSPRSAERRSAEVAAAAAGRSGGPGRESGFPMAQARRSSRTAKPRPKSPARVKQQRRRRRKRARSQHDAELIGLGLLAVGVFLACVLWFGLSGGPVPDGARSAIGWAAYVSPLVADSARGADRHPQRARRGEALPARDLRDGGRAPARPRGRARRLERPAARRPRRARESARPARRSSASS